jgi:acyl-CoA thioesterase-1
VVSTPSGLVTTFSAFSYNAAVYHQGVAQTLPCRYHMTSDHMRISPHVGPIVAFRSVVLLTLSLVGCEPLGHVLFPSYAYGDEDRLIGEGDPTVLVIGDSVMEFHIWDNATIADVIAEKTGRTVRNDGESGARLSASEDDIRGQYRSGTWQWVVMAGGANDLGDECGCGPCDATMDDMVSADGRQGEYPDLVRSIVADGSRALVMGYYEPPVGASTELSDCGPEFEELNRRLEAMARTTGGVYFASAADVIDPNNRGHYFEDLVHPSIEGSRLIGEQLAAVIHANAMD